MDTCLASQEIQEWIKNGKLKISDLSDGCVQPSSFEPCLTNEGFIIDTESGLFRSRKNVTIRECLEGLPEGHGMPVNLNGGFEMKKGFTYLFPLNTTVALKEGEYLKSSPKSSMGRVFLNVRLLTDYHVNFDEAHGQFLDGRDAQLWILVQPLVFNIVIHPGLSLNQLRFFRGYGARLGAPALFNTCEQQPILFREGTPAQHVITEDGLWLHLKIPQIGLGGLRARQNPIAIDVSKKDAYDPHAYFESISAQEGSIVIREGEHYLLSTKEVLKTPDNLNMELRSHSHIGLQGPLHFAGFIDNGFEGDLVLEVRSDEVTDVVLDDGAPIGVLDVYHTNTPTKIYGSAIGSHYYKQEGIRIAKFFKEFKAD
jgi:dCTP deaminase